MTTHIKWDDFLKFIREIPEFIDIEYPTGSIARIIFEKNTFNVHKPHHPYANLGISTIRRVQRLLAEKLGITHP